MKIVCISDTHGYLPKDLPNGDILVMAGDVCPASDHHVGFQAYWLENKFNPWLKSLPFKDKVIIAGNHDWIFDTHPDEVPELDCNYLNNSSVIIDDVKFYGFPDTPRFCDWAFNRDPHEMGLIVSKIPHDTNVLITHGPPREILDKVTEICWADSGHLGCGFLTEKVKDMPNLKLHVFGHIHSGHGIREINGTTYVNASYINEQYAPDYDIITVDI